jgi:hypothetical protein
VVPETGQKYEALEINEELGVPFAETVRAAIFQLDN